jgi:hypothetical protein
MNDAIKVTGHSRSRGWVSYSHPRYGSQQTYHKIFEQGFLKLIQRGIESENDVN